MQGSMESAPGLVFVNLIGRGLPDAARTAHLRVVPLPFCRRPAGGVPQGADAAPLPRRQPGRQRRRAGHDKAQVEVQPGMVERAHRLRAPGSSCPGLDSLVFCVAKQQS